MKTLQSNPLPVGSTEKQFNSTTDCKKLVEHLDVVFHDKGDNDKDDDDNDDNSCNYIAIFPDHKT